LKFEHEKAHVTVYKKCYMGNYACAKSDVIMYIVPDSYCIANDFFEICLSLSESVADTLVYDAIISPLGHTLVSFQKFIEFIF
jgi:hypothetical protein